MTKTLLVGALWFSIAAAGAPAMPQQRDVSPDRPNANAPKRAPAPSPPMVQLIEGIYVNALRQQAKQAEITDDQINRLLPFLRQYLRDRNEIGGARRLRVQRDLQQALNRGASDEELTRVIQQFDRIESDVQAAQSQFLANTDPILTIRQRAWFRVWQLRVEERIRRLIQEGAPQNPTAPPTPPRPGSSSR